MKTSILGHFSEILEKARTPGLIAAVLLSLLGPATTPVLAQRQVTEVLSQDEIGIVKTCPGFCTRITFPDDVTEVFCGDL